MSTVNLFTQEDGQDIGSLAHIDDADRGGNSARILRLYLKATGKEIKARKLNFCLGACACFIVVVVIALLITILANAPVLFMRLSELQYGEIDLLLDRDDRRYNFTRANATALSSAGGLRYTYGCPRLMVDSQVLLPRLSCPTLPTPTSSLPSSWPYTGYNNASSSCAQSTNYLQCLQTVCSTQDLSPATTLAIHQPAEQRAQIGRQWSVTRNNPFNGTRPLIAGTCFLSDSVAGQIGAVAGDTVLLRFSVDDALGSGTWRNATRGLTATSPSTPQTNATYVSQHQQVMVVLSVTGVYPGGGGKHASDVNGIIVDGQSWVEFIANNMNPLINPIIPQRLKDEIKWMERASVVAWNLPPLRVDNYRSADQSETERLVTGFMSSLLFSVSWTDVTQTLPVLVGVKSYRFFSLFLGLLLNIIILFVFFLSVMLIYSLLMVSVESRTFELGIMRMVGMSRPRVVGLVLTQALSFSVPAIAIGLPVAQGLAYAFTNFLQNLAFVQLSPLLTPLAICLSLFTGLLLPVVSAILPIRAALAKNIWDSVDTKRSKTKAVEYKLTRADTGRPSLSFLVIGLALFVLGFIIYYLLPLALLSSNIYMLLNLFFLVLICMLFGLVVLASNLQPLLEIGYMWLLFFWEKPAVRTVALRNFDAHRRRNSKTALMFSISLAFIIFLSVTFTTQINTLIVQTNQRRASVISLRVSRFNYLVQAPPATGLPVSSIEAYVATQPLIETFGWVTMPMEWQVQSLLDVGASSLGRYTEFGQDVRGVSPNLFNSTFTGFVLVSGAGLDTPGWNGPVESLLSRLYSRRGSASVMMGSKWAPSLGIPGSGNNRDLLLSHRTSRGTQVAVQSVGATTTSDASSSVYTYYRRLRVETFLDLAPLFAFSPYPSGVSNDMLMSLPAFVRQMRLAPNCTISSVDGLLMEFVLFKMRANITNSQYTQIKRDLTQVISASGAPNVDLLDSRDTTASLNTAASLINFFFLFTVVIALIICFFSLMSSMYTNIFEQKKEIGVMIALGIYKGWVRRMFVWEAICIVLSSASLGILIGVIVSWTMNLQQALFTQLPVPYAFPWLITVVVIGCSAIFGVLASVGPLATILRLSPVAILRSE